MNSGDDATGSPTAGDTGAGARGRSPDCELLAIFTGPAAADLDRRLDRRGPRDHL